MALHSSEHDEYRVAAVMGIVQGLSEFLPVSSSAHLSVIPWLLDWNGEEYAFFNTQTFDVALHMGTLLALVVTFWQDWLILIGHAHRPHTPAGRLFWLLVLASLPGAAVGAVLESRASG
ncbi:MAG: undecaprenyl-diphosphate phosphatase, partial [Herpetosiphonaceae bacterium]|nr:undecaprenyl-diphosphate phosphatase [Herpetosiphonaceae bacterium]